MKKARMRNDANTRGIAYDYAKPHINAEENNLADRRFHSFSSIAQELQKPHGQNRSNVPANFTLDNRHLKG
jgi:hypothetical protein